MRMHTTRNQSGWRRTDFYTREGGIPQRETNQYLQFCIRKKNTILSEKTKKFLSINFN